MSGSVAGPSTGAASVILGAIVSLCLYTSACRAVDDPDLLAVTESSSGKLELYNDKGKCAIRVNSSSEKVELGIPYPCGFVRMDADSGAQTYRYQGVGQVFVVAGPPADRESYKGSGVSYSHLCSDYGQAVIAGESGLTIRKSRNVPLGFCHLLGFDEKDFYGFAYPVE